MVFNNINNVIFDHYRSDVIIIMAIQLQFLIIEARTKSDELLTSNN